MSSPLQIYMPTTVVSISHLGRIETGDRSPSTRTLQKVAKHLGFDLYELLVIGGHLKLDHTIFSEEEREKLRIELNMLSNRATSDLKRINGIINRLLMS